MARLSRGSPTSVRTVRAHQAFLTIKTLALSQTSVFESQTRAIQGPTWKASATLLADRRWRLIPRGTPKAQVAAELSVRAPTLRELYPGARVARDALANANKAEAATTTS